MAILVYIILATGVSYLPPLFGFGDRISWFLIYLFVATILLVVIAWKTGEPPRWQWGEKREKDPAIK